MLRSKGNDENFEDTYTVDILIYNGGINLMEEFNNSTIYSLLK